MRPVTDLQRKVKPFEVISDYIPSGDQPTAIADLTRRIEAGEQDVVLLGATGTGKSATTAWLIEQLQRPTLVLAPNKTLAAQLANEFFHSFPLSPLFPLYSSPSLSPLDELFDGSETSLKFRLGKGILGNVFSKTGLWRRSRIRFEEFIKSREERREG